VHTHIIFNSLPTVRDKILFKILYFTGARIREVLDLEIDNIPIPDSTKNVEVLLNIKSKGKVRNLYIPMNILIDIDNFIIDVRSKIDIEHDYIFVSQQKQNLGKPLTYRGIYEVFKTVQLKTGISFNFHDLRHTFVTNMVQSGMDLSVVQILAGHKQISTTQQYLHLSNNYVNKSMNDYWKVSSYIGDVENVFSSPR
jgi:integrase/recombinase XerD